MRSRASLSLRVFQAAETKLAHVKHHPYFNVTYDDLKTYRFSTFQKLYKIRVANGGNLVKRVR